ncbi:MAG: ribokinase [Anaerolineae bacterium]|nr:ribokinase [Chloroflexota bacterium]
MSDVVVLGSLNMDLVVRTTRIPRPGETVHGHDFGTVPGGKGANQAAAAARLGAHVTMLGRVGQDAFGDAMVENMLIQGVETGYILRDRREPSGIALIQIQDDGDNSIVVAPGANGRVSTEDVDRAVDLIWGASFLVTQFEVPLPTVHHAIGVAASKGVPVILNPAPAYAVDADWLTGVYCLVVNETEAETLTGLPVTSLAEARTAGIELQAMGVPVVIVTLGAQGALLVADGKPLHVPARQVDVVDTTAAGDAFIGGLVASLDRGMDLRDAVHYATCAGSLATTVLGAQTSLPDKAAVDAFYREGQR